MPFPTSLSPTLLLRPRPAASYLLRRHLLPLHAHHHRRRRSLLLSSSSSSSSSLRPSLKHPLSTMSPSSSSSSLSSSPSQNLTPTTNPNPNPNSSAVAATATTTRARKKAYRESPEGVLRRDLDHCSKRGDLAEALRLYDSARASSVPLSLHHYNVLLYLCSSSSSSSADLDRGFEILRHMAADPSVAPNEATFTSAARLAAAKRDPALAFDLVHRMAAAGIPPRLRSYGPALFGFCDAGDLAGAHAVEAHMAASAVDPEEPELAALLAANARAGDGGHVYRVLHRLRSVVRVVSERTAEIAESWFGSEAAAEAGVAEWDEEKVREGVVKGGGGWHGQGWLGTGPWSLGRSEMDEDGVCRRCGERLVCIDIDPSETEDFAKSLASLASQREVKADFLGFQV